MPFEQAKLLTAEVQHATSADVYGDARRMLREECDAETLVEQMQYLDTRLYLAGDILTKVDRASMAVSLEVRAFLDYRVAEYAASLPLNYKLRGRTSKYVLKQAARELVPAFVGKRGKKGFGVPVAEWLKKTLRPLARDLLSPERLRRHGLFDPQYVTRLQDEHERGIANHRKLLWTLLMFELWHESFIDTPRRIESHASEIRF
jgi:asparagine synthase (glutamine-hydrolysing)